MAENNSRPNPYIGPRAFQTGEKLHGRDRELRELLNFMLSQRIVLLYSPSGAGKTSLIQAGLIPSLESRGFSILPVIRVNLEPALPEKLDLPEDRNGTASFNRYVYSALLSLEEGLPETEQIPAEELTKLTFDEYLQQRSHQVSTTEREDSTVEALIFDQFEEILTIDPTDQANKIAFFSRLGDALRNRRRWALFSMREDYIAALDPFLRYISTHLNSRYRLDLLGVEAALQAILHPVRNTGVDFTEDAAMKLVDDLRRVRIQRQDGSIETQPGLYVEPVQLQVVCKRLWQNLDPESQQITAVDVSKIGDVNQSLREYYSDEVAAIAAQSNVPERAIREWINRWLITEQGFRGQVLMGSESSEGLDNRAIRLLEDAHLVRAERRRGATWFELAHDRLIEPVMTDNTAWLQAHLSPLQRQAALWDDEGRPEGLLFTDQTLIDAQDWAAENEQNLTPTEREFLQVCEVAAQRAKREKTTNRVIRLLAVGALLAAILAIFFGVFSSRSYLISQDRLKANQTLAATNALMAEENADIAAIAKANAATAESASTQAVKDRFAAEAAQANAEEALLEAETQREEADRQKIAAENNAELASWNEALATSRQFAAQALGYLRDRPDLASLLAIEAYATADTFEARDALLTVLLKGTEGAVQDFDILPVEINDITGVTFSSDGQRLAWGNTRGEIVIWNYRNQEVEMRIDCADSCSRITALDWSPNSQTLAYATGEGSIFLKSLEGEDEDMLSNGPRVLDLAFNPDGSQLAAGVGNSLIVWEVATKKDKVSPPYNSRVESIDWSQDGSLLALGIADNTVRVIDKDSLETSASFEMGESNQLNNAYSPWQKKISVAWSPHEQYNHWLAIANLTGKIILWDVVSKEIIAEAFVDDEKPKQIYNIAFARDGSMIAGAGESLEVALWSVPDLKPVAETRKHKRMVVDLDFSPISGDALFASASYDRTVGLFQLVKQQPYDQLEEPKEGSVVIGVRTLEDGSPQAVRLEVEDARVGAYMLEKEPQSYAINDSGSLLALGYEDGGIEIIDLEIELLVENISDVEKSVHALTFLNDQELAFSYCEIQGGTSTAGKPLCNQNILGRLDIQSSDIEKIPQEQTDFIRALAYDSNFGVLASGGDSSAIELRSLNNGQPFVSSFPEVDELVTHLAFSPDGRLLAFASDNRTLTLWDMTTNRPIGEPFSGFSGGITSLVFAPDSLALYSGHDDGSLLRWDIDPRSWVELNCELAGSDQTDEELLQIYSTEEAAQNTFKPCAQYP